MYKNLHFLILLFVCIAGCDPGIGVDEAIKKNEELGLHDGKMSKESYEKGCKESKEIYKNESRAIDLMGLSQWQMVAKIVIETLGRRKELVREV